MRSVRIWLDTAVNELPARARHLLALHFCVTSSVVTRAIGLVVIFLTFTISSNAVSAESELDRLNDAWSNVHDYSVTIHAHESLGKRSDDRDLHYAFRKPARARLDLISGRKSIATLVWSGGDDVIAYRPGLLAFVRVRGNIHDRRFTSLRGNGVLTPALGDIIDCFERNKDSVTERRGPTVEGGATVEIALSGRHALCADESTADSAVTLDVIDVSQQGLVVIRQRYEGKQLVEAWYLTDYRINTGLDDLLFELAKRTSWAH